MDILLSGAGKLILGLIAGLFLVVLPFWHICKRTGLHPALSFLSIIPLANIIFRFYLACSRWPACDTTGTPDSTQTSQRKHALFTIIGSFLLATAPLVLITGIAYTLTLPKIYASRVLVQTVFTKDAYKNYNAEVLENLTHTYAEKISRRPLLQKISRQMNLPIVWSKNNKQLGNDIVFKILKSSISVLRHRNSMDLITISVRRENPTEAARIANTLAEVYQNTAKNDLNQASPYSIVILEKAVPAKKPVSPNLILNTLISLGAASVFILIGTPFLIIGLKSKQQITTN